MKNSWGVVLEKVVEEALSEETTFEQRPGCRERVSKAMWCLEKSLQGRSLV